jgi:hypothetical protein
VLLLLLLVLVRILFNVRQRDDEDDMDVCGNDKDEEKVRPPIKRSTYKSSRSSSQQLLLGPSPPVPIVAFPQANLQITTVSDDTVQMEELSIKKIPDDNENEDFVDDNRDLAIGY